MNRKKLTASKITLQTSTSVLRKFIIAKRINWVKFKKTGQFRQSTRRVTLIKNVLLLMFTRRLTPDKIVLKTHDSYKSNVKFVTGLIKCMGAITKKSESICKTNASFDAYVSFTLH